MGKTTLPPVAAIRATGRSYIALVDRQALTLARKAWKEAKEQVRPAKMTHANIRAIRDAAQTIVETWREQPTPGAPMFEFVAKFLEAEDPWANMGKIGFVLTGTEALARTKQAHAIVGHGNALERAVQAIYEDLEADALAYVDGLAEQHSERL